MGKEIIAVKTPARVVYRIVGKIVYIKGNVNQYAEQLAKQIVAKGGKISYAANWVKADMFGDNTLFNLKDHTIDFESNLITNKSTKEIMTASDENIETVLTDFFKQTLEMSGFVCEVKNI